ncbi:Bacterial SH3 domain protein [Erysipelatoclostridium ramosum]|uniref:Bacterial SH3 domain protein n=1 Tax=Thomasclavelia ramosa TaxID=1547 RepID=A0A6N3AE03_9FIRM
MSTVNELLNQARAWIGKKESNGSHKEIIDIYNGHKPLARGYKVKYTDSWCATFISALAIKCNCTDIIPTEASCGKMIELFKNIGCWQEDGNVIPRVGDIIFYDWDKKDGWPEHVGIVESVSGNQITAIEGNKSDAVARRTIAVGNTSIRGYGVPKYSGSNSQFTPKPSEVNYKVRVNTPSGVNCRNTPNGAKVKAYANGTELTISKEENGWGFTGEGWVSLQYCTKIQDSVAQNLGTYEVIASDLSVRTGPGENYRRKTYNELTVDAKKHDYDKDGCLNKGTRVTVKEWKNGFARIPSGWVSGDYLKKV